MVRVRASTVVAEDIAGKNPWAGQEAQRDLKSREIVFPEKCACCGTRSTVRADLLFYREDRHWHVKTNYVERHTYSTKFAVPYCVPCLKHQKNYLRWQKNCWPIALFTALGLLVIGFLLQFEVHDPKWHLPIRIGAFVMIMGALSVGFARQPISVKGARNNGFGRTCTSPGPAVRAAEFGFEHGTSLDGTPTPMPYYVFEFANDEIAKLFVEANPSATVLITHNM